MNIPSCGESLLKSPINTFDYVLCITDGTVTVKVLCHKCVLLTHSPKLQELINNENFFDLEIEVKPGYITATLELIQYMYLKNPKLFTDQVKVLQVCGMFYMNQDYRLIRNSPPVTQENNNFTNIILQVGEAHPSVTARLLTDFLKCVEMSANVMAVQEVVKVDKTKKRLVINCRMFPRRRTRSNKLY